MTREEALELLGVKPDAGADAIRARMRELYSEHQLRLTNAPTTNLKLTYQRNLAELDEAGRALLGADASLDEIKDLPIAEPANVGKASVPRSSFAGKNTTARLSADEHPSRRSVWAWVLPIVLAGVIGGLAYWVGSQRGGPGSATADTSHVAGVPTPRDSVNVPRSVVTADTTRLTPPQQTGKDSARVNPLVVRRDTAKPTPVVRRDTAKAPTVVTPTVTQREDYGGYGPYRWRMTTGDVRAITERVALSKNNDYERHERVMVSLKNGQGLPDEDLLFPFFQCGDGREFRANFWFLDDGHLSSIMFVVDGKCPGVDELAAKLISRYKMVRRYPKSADYEGRSSYWVTEHSRIVHLWRVTYPDQPADLSFAVTKP